MHDNPESYQEAGRKQLNFNTHTLLSSLNSP